jgi:hypothetical protein
MANSDAVTRPSRVPLPGLRRSGGYFCVPMRPPGIVRLVAAGAACLALVAVHADTSSPSSALRPCGSPQLKLTGHLQGATQSLLGTFTLTNHTARACALPVAPRRVSLVIGTQVLPVLTERMSAGSEPPGVPTRRLAGHGRVGVGVQWRNWCGAPRGNVHLSVRLSIFPSVSPRAAVGLVSTPPCVDHKYSSRVAVSRFIKT